MNATAQHEEPGWDLNLCRGTIREHWRCIPKALEKVWDIPAIKAGLGADTDAPVNIPAQYTSRGTPLNHFWIGGGMDTMISVVRTIVGGGTDNRQPMTYISMRDIPECCPQCFLSRSSLRLAALTRLMWPWLRHPEHRGLFDDTVFTPYMGMSPPCVHRLFFKDWGSLPEISEEELDRLVVQVGDI